MYAHGTLHALLLACCQLPAHTAHQSTSVSRPAIQQQRWQPVRLVIIHSESAAVQSPQLPLVCRTQQFLPQDKLPPQEQLPISQLCVTPTACCRSVLVTQAAHSHSPFLTPSVQVGSGGAGEGLGEGEGLGTGGAVHTRLVQMAVPWQSQLVAQAWPMRQAAPQPPPPLRTT